MPPGETIATKQDRRQFTERILTTMSPQNGARLRMHMEQNRNKGIQESSIYSATVAIGHADRILAGKDFNEAGPQDLMRVLTTFRTIYGANSLRTRAVAVRAHLRWMYQTRPGYDQDRLPRALEMALTVKREKPQEVGQVIPDDDYRALLAAITPRASLRLGFPLDVRDRCILSSLRHGGWRVSEGLALNVGTVRIEQVKLEEEGQVIYEGPAARLELPKDAYDLKTGVRTIYVIEGVEELRAWLAIHPFRNDPKAPLFINGDGERLGASRVRNILTELAERAGLECHKRQPLTPHDFRHTCATEKVVKHNWSDAKLRRFFGWGPKSEMPDHYAHLRLEHMRDQAARDAAKRTAPAAPAPAPAVLDLNTLAAALRQVMQQPEAPKVG